MHCNASHMTLEGCNFKGGHYKSFFFLWTPKKRILAEKMFFWTRIENLEWKSSTKPLKIGRNSHPLNADYGHYIQNAKSASKFKQWCGDSEFELHVKFQVNWLSFEARIPHFQKVLNFISPFLGDAWRYHLNDQKRLFSHFCS